MKFMGLNPSLFGGELFLDAFGSEFDLTCDAENQAVANMRKKFLKNNGLNMITLMTKDARSHKNYNMKIINKITRIDSTKYKLIRNNIVILLDKYNRPINVENDQLYNDIKSNYTVIIWAPVVFTDAGRDWIKTTNLIKWNKGDNQIKTYSLKNG